MGTKNERSEGIRNSREESMQLEQKRGEISKETLGLAWDSEQSNYDLRPR
jgi:hypothetical protein